jgi:hypothetical protein
MHGAAGFLDSFVQDEVKCRCLSLEDFGAPLDNAENDVPLYDMYNRGLAACEQGLERQNLQLEGMERPGKTGYIPSVEEALEGRYPGTVPMPKQKLVVLPPADATMALVESKKRRGLIR